MISVSELNEKIKAILEATFMHTMVEGEVSSATYHSSGHLYFTIKDAKSSIKCVMWRSNVKKLKFKIESGEHIVVDGSIGVYTPRGEYQLIAVNVEPYGKGALAVAFEQLKKKLEAKGYFKKEHKKDIPKFPKKVAVVTALNGAALQDILKVAQNRWALTEFIIIDTLVQGDMAAAQIANGIRYADSLDVDIILVSRGGGSQEDLWAFNEEVVADAIYAAKTPVVSAVGHEVDFLISDFVADLRAPTPSAAIETILPDYKEYLFLLDDMLEKFNTTIEQKISIYSQKLDYLSQRVNALSPKEKLNFYANEFKSLETNLNEIIKHKLTLFNNKITPLNSQLDSNLSLIFRKKEGQLRVLNEQLALNNPENRVKSGFVEVTKNGLRVDICKIKEGENLELVSNKCKLEVVASKKPSAF